jgi:hypothetical protein
MADEIIIDPHEELPPPRTWDFFLTFFLLFVLVIITAIFMFSGFGLTLTTIGCGDSGGQCNSTVLSIGILTSIGGPAIIALAGIITTIVFIARRHRSFLVPLVSCLVSVGVFMLGSWLVDLAVPGL